MLICINSLFKVFFFYKEFLKKGVLVVGTVGKKNSLKQKEKNFLKNANKQIKMCCPKIKLLLDILKLSCQFFSCQS